MSVYVDASVAAKLVVAEAEPAALVAFHISPA